MDTASSHALENMQGAASARGVGRWVAGALAIAFGLATLAEGGHVLFGGAEARAAAGNVVMFVLVFNFSAGLFYVFTGGATLLRKSWAVWLARLLALSTLAIFAALAVHIAGGGAFEKKTLAAMTLRSAFWIGQALMLPRVLGLGRNAP